VLARRQAIVIGPTPPGTGVIAPATSEADVEFHVADQTRLSRLLGMRHPGDADVDHRRPGFDPIAPHHLRPADGRDEDVGAAADLGQVLRARMGDRDRAVFPQQKLRHRFAKQVRAPDDDRLFARERVEPVPAAASDTPAACNLPGHLPRWPEARIRHAQPVDILCRIDPRNGPSLIQMIGHRKLAQDAVHLRVRVQLVDKGEQVLFGRVGRQACARRRPCRPPGSPCACG
jgi:hypothetical protein